MMRTVLISVLVAASAAEYCESKALSYAHCTGSVEFTTGTCSQVFEVISGRAAGSQSGKWTDPHNKGAYILEGNSTTEIDVKRVTGSGKYTDKMSFTLSASEDGAGCKVNVCSKSQVFSVEDFGTNW